MSLIAESYWIAGLVSLSGAGVLLLCYNAFFHPLAQFPGPRLASITGLWRLYHYAIGDWHDLILDLHRRYGRVVRLAPNELSVVDESAMKALYGHGTPALKSNWYSAFQSPQAAPNQLATQDPQISADIRRRMAPAFKMTALLRLESSMQDCFDKLWQQLDKPASEGAIVDMCHWTDTLTWDVIGQLCYGEPLGSIAGAGEMNVQGILIKFLMVSTVLGHVWGQLFWIENPLTRLLGIKNPLSKFFEWSSMKVRQHQESDRSGVQPDMIDHFLAYRDSEGKPPTRLQVVDGATATIGAGADTVGIAMRSVLYYLSINPAVVVKLQKEIDALDSSESISFRQTQQLPYLKAVARESLRMYSSVPAQLYRIVPDGGLSVDGHFIPPGTIVGMCSLAQNRDTAIFGQDVDVFKPDRWLGDEARGRYLENALFNFGGTGPRSCPGRDLAMIELYKFVAQMVQQFDFELVDKERPWSVKTYFFALHTDMWMKLARREKRVEL